MRISMNKLFGVFLFLITRQLLGEIMISGTVQDKASRHTLSGANIYFAKTDHGTTSDRFGRFQIKMDSWISDTLIVSFIGFETQKINLMPTEKDTILLNIELTRKILLLNELRIEGNRYQDELHSLHMDIGSMRMNHQEMRTIPYSLYPDVNRSLQFLPGVTSCNELTNELNVRGGSPDQNLVLLEGVPVYYPFHVFGLASAFNPDMIGEVHFSPGGFSAEYGNRLGSVLDIHAHSPQKNLETSVDISLIAADVTTSGRHKNVEWIVSLRKSYYDMLLKSVGTGVPYSFFDAFSRIAFVPNSSHNFALMFFTFKDRFRDSQEGKDVLYDYPQEPPNYVYYKVTSQRDYSWQNGLWSVMWDFQLPHHLLSHVQIYHSIAQNNFLHQVIPYFPRNLSPEYFENRKEKEKNYQDSRTDVTNRFYDKSIQFNLNWHLHDSVIMMAGGQYSRFDTDYGWGWNNLPSTPMFDYRDYIRLYFDYAPESYFKFKKNVNLLNFYYEAISDIATRLHIRIGFQTNKWSTQLKHTFEPRLSLNYDMGRCWKLKTSYGYYTQGIATALEDGVIGFLRLYFPLGDSLSLESSQHYLSGIEYDSGKGQKLDVNLYYKNYAGLIKSIGPQPNFIQTPGKAYGLEIFGQWNKNDWNMWMAFTWARAFRLINNIKNDFNWDQRIKLSTYLSTGIGRNWRIAGTWLIYSGVPYAITDLMAVSRSGDWQKGIANMKEEFFDTQSIGVPPGRIRYPWYHRMDFSLIKEFHFSKWHMETYFALRNVYMRKNPLYYESSELAYEMQNGKRVNYYVKHPFKWLPPIPTIGIRAVL
jgi:hypothetical protein